MRYYKNIAIVSVFFAIALPAYAQECQNILPDTVSWSGTSHGLTKWNPGSSPKLQISKTIDGKYIIADLTAGFFEANGIPYQIEIEINLSCDATVSPKAFASDFGDGSIKSGQWDAETRRLSIQWEIPKNNLNETSIFSAP